MTALADLRSWWRHRNDPPAVKAITRKGIQVGSVRTGSRFPESARLSAQRSIRAALDSFGHRNDPPVLLPDCVTREVKLGRHLTEQLIDWHRHLWEAAGWTLEDTYVDPARPSHTVFVLRRYDGEMGETTTRRGH